MTRKWEKRRHTREWKRHNGQRDDESERWARETFFLISFIVGWLAKRLPHVQVLNESSINFFLSSSLVARLTSTCIGFVFLFNSFLFLSYQTQRRLSGEYFFNEYSFFIPRISTVLVGSINIKKNQIHIILNHTGRKKNKV
jgi:biotin transporter BioY